MLRNSLVGCGLYLVQRADGRADRLGERGVTHWEEGLLFSSVPHELNGIQLTTDPGTDFVLISFRAGCYVNNRTTLLAEEFRKIFKMRILEVMALLVLSN